MPEPQPGVVPVPDSVVVDRLTAHRIMTMPAAAYLAYAPLPVVSERRAAFPRSCPAPQREASVLLVVLMWASTLAFGLCLLWLSSR